MAGVEGLGIDAVEGVVGEAKVLSTNAAGVFADLGDGEVEALEFGTVGEGDGDGGADAEVERVEKGNAVPVAGVRAVEPLHEHFPESFAFGGGVHFRGLYDRNVFACLLFFGGAAGIDSWR